MENKPGKNVEVLLIRALGKGLSSLPLGIMSIHEYLKNNEYSSMIFDRYCNTNIQDLLKLVKSLKHLKIIGISAMTIQLPDAVYLARLLRTVNKSAKIIMGGTHVTALPDSVKEYVDHVVVGEGEIAVKKFLDNNCEGEYILKGEFLEDLDSVSFMDVKEAGKFLSKGSIFYFLTARGCPYRCNFCLGSEQREKRIRYISIEKVADYVKQVVEELGITSFFIADDIFVLNLQRVAKFCELVQKNIPQQLSFQCFTHSGHGREDTYKTMKAAGFDVISMGVEHGTNELLQFCGKETTLEKIDETCDKMHRAGIRISASYILGNIPEDNNTITKTVEFAKYLHKKYNTKSWFSYAQPQPGSTMYADSKQSGKILQPNVAKWTNFSPTYLPEKVDLDHMIRERERGRREANPLKRVNYWRLLTNPQILFSYLRTQMAHKIVSKELERINKELHKDSIELNV